MYNTKFIVKYKSIEEELINKLEREKSENENENKDQENKDQEKEEQYTKEDIYTICEELYRHEFLSVFQIEIVDETTIQDAIIELWDKIQLNDEFMKLIDFYSDKILLGTADINSFIMMFNYDMFFLLHPCICNCIENKELDSEIINKLIFKINNL